MADETQTQAQPATAAAAETTPASTSLLSTVAAAPTEGAAPGTEAAEAKPPQPVIPETYTFAAPEGAKVDDGRLAEFQAAAKDAGLTQEQFQKLASYGFEHIGKAANAPHEAWTALQQQWTNEVKADPEIGGAKLEQSLGAAKLAIDAFGGNALRQALDATGAGNNPAIVRAFVEMGRRMQDGSAHVAGKPAGAASRDGSFEGIASRIYPNMATTGA